MVGLAIPVGREAPNAAARYGGRLRLDAEPGTKWAYANHGFNVLGYLVETLSGEPYAAHMRSVLFEPLGMDDTDVTRTRPRRRSARDGVRQPPERSRVAQGHGHRDPAGRVVFSTLPDMARYAAALLDGGHGVVKPDTLTTAFEPHYRPCPSHPGIGLSFFRADVGGHVTVGHGGGVPGFVTAFALAPDDGVGVVAFTNGGGQSVALAAHRVLCALLGVEARPPRRRLQPEHWNDLIGYYRPDPGPLTNARVLVLGGGVEIAVRGRRLVVRTATPLPGLGKGVPMRPVDDDGSVYAVDLARDGNATARRARRARRGPARRAALRWSGRGRVPRVAQDEWVEEPRRGPCGRGRRRPRRCRAQADEAAPLRLPNRSATRWPCSRARRAMIFVVPSNRPLSIERIATSWPATSARSAPTVHCSRDRCANGSKRYQRIAFSCVILFTSASGTS